MERLVAFVDWVFRRLGATPSLPNLPYFGRAAIAQIKSTGTLGNRCQVCGTPGLHGGISCPYTGKFEISSQQLEHLLTQHSTGGIHLPELLLWKLQQLAQPEELRKLKEQERLAAERAEQARQQRERKDEKKYGWRKRRREEDERYWAERERVGREKAEQEMAAAARRG